MLYLCDITKAHSYNMETTNIIQIKNPSMELVAFIEKAQRIKREHMQQMRENFLQAQMPKSK